MFPLIYLLLFSKVQYSIKWGTHASQCIFSAFRTQKIREIYNIKEKLNFLIGTDAFEKIESWYKVEELSELVHFIVFPRGVELSDKSGWDYEMAPMDFLDVSSTEIRKNKNDNIKEVKDYIDKNDLYVWIY